MIYFLDTNICIFHINNSAPDMSDKLENFQLETIKIPSIVAAELLYGTKKSRRKQESQQRCKEFISLFEVVGFDANAAEYYADIRVSLEAAGRPIGGNDIIIAAITKANGGILVTNNTKEFSRVDGLLLADWTQ